MDAARTLFGTLNAAADLERLKGTPEDLHLEVKECHAPLPANMKGQRVFKWSLILGLSNEGRALARYPMLDLVCPLEPAPDTRYGLDGNGREGLSRRPTVGAVKDKKVRALYVGDAGTGHSSGD